MDSYTYVIVGGGASGLLLAEALCRKPRFKDTNILLLEKDPVKGNDRTWCFWETGKGAFDSLVHRQWKQIYFAGKAFSTVSPIAPYTYKMLRGIDFYNEYYTRVTSYPNLTLVSESVTAMREAGNKVIVETSRDTYTADYVFNSVFSWDDLLLNSKFPVLQQHFIGWFIKTPIPVFDPETATFMDFSVAQKGNTRFMYVLPFSKTEALVEYTLFSPTLLEEMEYEDAIAHYLENTLGCKDFEILSKEKGRIPMTCHDFGAKNSGRIVNIGAAGGWAKPSTGFTFMNTHRKIMALTAHLASGKPISAFGRKNRFWWYDLLLLDILERDNSRGSVIFEALFKKRKPALILKFLDEQTSFWEDLQIIWACPKRDFILVLFRRMFKGKFLGSY